MTDTNTTAPSQEQQPTSTFTVHVYREMRLRFDGIRADSPEQAAEKAREMHFDDADDWSDCEGQSLAALVDVSGDEGYEQSRVIDFEPGRMLNAAPKLLAALTDLLAVTELNLDDLENGTVEALEFARAAIAEATDDSVGRVA